MKQLLIAVFILIFMISLASAVTYQIVEQCDDGIRNYDETGVDCGGKCDSCSLIGRVIQSFDSGSERDNGQLYGPDVNINNQREIKETGQKVKETIQILFEKGQASPFWVLSFMALILVMIILYLSKKVLYK